MLASRVAQFSRVLLLDLHSFMGPIANDVCLGDAHGTTCATTTTAAVGTALRDRGFDVVVNAPFTGGYVIRAHAAPPAIQALQIELRYTTYLDCARIDEPEIPTADPARIAMIQDRLRPAFAAIVAALG